MPRKTKIVGFSLSPEIHDELETLLKKEHKTRSGFLRELIDSYSKSTEIVTKSYTYSPEDRLPDLAKILRSFWQTRSTIPLKVIIVGLGIIVDKKGRVLIGSRADKDPWVKNLSWVFPGGSMSSLDFETELKKKMLLETGLLVSVNSLVSTRIHPDAFFKKAQVVALYFHCSPANENQIIPGNGLSELKWVWPTEVYKYFTNSVSDDVAKFLFSLEEGN